MHNFSVICVTELGRSFNIYRYNYYGLEGVRRLNIAMHKNFTISLDEETVRRAKAIAGLIPFSRYVESLLLKEIEHKRRVPHDDV
jgi:hypothetical protein